MRKPLSLTSRLTLLFGLILTVVLSASGVFMFNAMGDHFVEQDAVVLRSHAHELIDVLNRGNGMPMNPRMREALNQTNPRHDLYFEILDAQGHPILQQGNVQAPPDVMQAMTHQQGMRPFHWGKNGQNYRSILDKSNGYSVMVTMSTMHHDVFLANFGERLFGILGLTLILTWGLSWFVVRKGLAPLQLIQNRAAKVNLGNLDKNIPLNRIPAELVPLATELNGMMERLEESFKRLVSFSSDLAHEMRTPVSNLLTQIQVALTHDRTLDNYKEVLASSAEECERLSRMISEILFLAKAENGGVLPTVEVVDLGEQIDQVMDYYEPLADSRGMTLTRAGERAAIEGDRSMVRRAISNLVSNAIRHGYQDTQVVIATALDAHQILLSVTNAGEQIPKEHLKHIFDRFYRVNTSRTNVESEGLGLGLAITRAIMKAHQGDISVVSTDEGTTFTLRFPRPQSAG